MKTLIIILSILINYQISSQELTDEQLDFIFKKQEERVLKNKKSGLCDKLKNKLNKFIRRNEVILTYPNQYHSDTLKEIQCIYKKKSLYFDKRCSLDFNHKSNRVRLLSLELQKGCFY